MRRMQITGVRTAARRVTFTGRVVRPLGKPDPADRGPAARLVQPLAGRQADPAVSRTGRFRVDAQRARRAASPRPTASPRASAQLRGPDSRKTFETFTLPRFVDLGGRRAEAAGPRLGRVDERFEDHLLHPRGRGFEPDGAHHGAAGGAACGDLVRIALRVEGDRVAGAGFEASGCGAAIAAASAAVELAAARRCSTPPASARPTSPPSSAA